MYWIFLQYKKLNFQDRHKVRCYNEIEIEIEIKI